jgi:prevent-host-death family protein
LIVAYRIDYNYSQDKRERRAIVTKTIPLIEAKKSLSAIIRDIDEKYDRFTITRNGVEKAIIMSSEEFDGLMETLDILSHKEEKEAIIRAKEQVRKGKTVSIRDFRSRLKIK